MSGHSRVISVQPVVQLLNKTAFWTSAYFYFLRGMSAVLVSGGLIQVFQSWSVITKFSSVGFFGGLLFQAIFILNLTLLSQLLWLRAESFRRIPQDSYTLLRIGAKLSRLFGECFAIGVGLYSIGSGILYWFAGTRAARVVEGALPGYPTYAFWENNFIHGLSVMITGTIAALGVLIVSYLVAQALLVLVGNAIKLNAILPGEDKSEAA